MKIESKKCEMCPRLLRGTLIKVAHYTEENIREKYALNKIGQERKFYALFEPEVGMPWQYFPENDPDNVHYLSNVQCMWEYGVDVITALDIPDIFDTICIPIKMKKGDKILATMNSVYVIRR